MKEYPSRSNLNCFLSFNEASAKGGALLKFRFWIVDIRKTEKAIIFFVVIPQGLEPRFTGPKPVVLPLDEGIIYSVGPAGLEPATP